MSSEHRSTLHKELKSAPPFDPQILSPRELDAVAGGCGLVISDDTTGTTSVCHVDGNNEPGTD